MIKIKLNGMIQKVFSKDTLIETIEQIEREIKKESKMAIVLYNDDHNSFDHVIRCLIKYCNHSLIQAEQCTMIIHEKGKIDVKRGDFDELLPIHEALLDNNLQSCLDYI